jgi:hypothetical protein
LSRLALLIQRRKPGDIQYEIAARQLGGRSGQIAAQQLRIKHDEFLFFWANLQAALILPA